MSAVHASMRMCCPCRRDMLTCACLSAVLHFKLHRIIATNLLCFLEIRSIATEYSVKMITNQCFADSMITFLTGDCVICLMYVIDGCIHNYMLCYNQESGIPIILIRRLCKFTFAYKSNKRCRFLFTIYEIKHKKETLTI